MAWAHITGYLEMTAKVSPGWVHTSLRSLIEHHRPWFSPTFVNSTIVWC